MSHALVIAAYFGIRRRSPKGAENSYQMMKFYTHAARVIHPGCDCDVIIAVSEPDPVFIDEPEWAERAVQYVESLHGTPTATGRFIVYRRPNTGVCFGAFSETFAMFRDRYDYFCFCEDDWIFIRDGYLAQAISQLEEDSGIGSVAMLCANQDNWGTFAKGGKCTTSTAVWDRVAKLSPEGRIGYTGSGQEASKMAELRLKGSKKALYNYRADGFDEHRFTRCINTMLGLEIVNLQMEKAIMPWGWNRGDWTEKAMAFAPWPQELSGSEAIDIIPS